MDLTDKVAVVTGASRGLGRAIAHAFAEQGARIYGLARSEDDLADVREEIGDAFTPLACDVTDGDSVRQAFSRLADDAGRCDVLVNNAGIGGFGNLEELEDDQWETMLDVNLRGVILCTRAALPMMKAQNERDGFGGHVVNIASVAGLVGNAQISVYNMTKFGVRGFSEALMKEVRDDRIKVTCVYPGSIATHFFQAAGSTASSGAMDPRDVAASILHAVASSPNYLVSEIMMRPLRPKGI
jgi:NAD(P)-dependent dehydrogenase (short-subunit alcohol dehydrogenase family)